MPNDAKRWEASRFWAGVVRGVAWLGPILVSFLAARALASRLRAPGSFGEVLLWWSAVIGASMLTFRIAERGARRILPLAALLRLSMVFPDKAPSRFKIARNAGNLKQLREQLSSIAHRDHAIDLNHAVEIILSLVSALSSHDRRTRGHSERTRVYTDLLAEELDLPRQARDRLRWAALLHDIGKIEIAAEILNKDGRPDEDEWAILKRHPADGARIIEPLREWLGGWAQAVEHHHERYDGTGYPAGLAGEDISLAGRIVAVADAFETMTAARPYKKPIPVAAARQELVDSAGTHFDPVVVRAFLNLSLGRSRWLPGFVSSVVQTPFASGVQRFAEQLGLAARTLAAGAAVVGGGVVTAVSPAPTPPPVPVTTGVPTPTLLRPVSFPTHGPQPEPRSVPAPPAPDPVPAPAPGLPPHPERPPEPGADHAQTSEDVPVIVPVLANDDDLDGDLLPSTLQIASPPASGTAAVTAEATVRYVPDADAVGEDLFRYRVCDSVGLCGTAGVRVTVRPVDDAPRPADDTATVAEDGSVVVNVGANDTDPEDNIDPETLALAAGPSHGSASVDPTTHRIRYSPAQDHHGSDRFTYRICDTTGLCATAVARVTVTPVNDPFTAVDDAATTAEDQSIVIAVLANDLDVDGNIDPLSVSVPPESSFGALSARADGTVRYVPAANEHGADAFTYTACDTAGSCGSAQVAILVAPVDDPPRALDDSASVISGVPVVIDVAADDSDPDGDLDPSSVTVAVPAVNGSAIPNGDGTITYTADPSFTGTDTFRYRICDTSGLCASAEVIVAVGGNRAPIAHADWTATEEKLTIRVVVLANDIDRDRNIDPSSVLVLSQPVSGKASASANADGTITYVAPDGGYHQDDWFTYRVCDLGGLCDAASVTVAVSHPDSENDPPAAGPDAAFTDEDTAVVIDLLANDLDVNDDMDPSSVSIVTAPAFGSVSIDGASGAATYTPSPDVNGTDTFRYRVCDLEGVCGRAWVTVEVDPVDDAFAPSDDAAATDEDAAVVVAVTANDLDVDGGVDPTTVTIVAAPKKGAAAVDGSSGDVTYTPAPDQNGSDTFAYRVCAMDGDCGVATVSIAISPIDDPPVAAADTAATPVDTPVTIDVAANDTDPDGDLEPSTVSVLRAPANGTATSNGDGTITYAPGTGWAGDDTFDYQICDASGMCAAGTVQVRTGP